MPSIMTPSISMTCLNNTCLSDVSPNKSLDASGTSGSLIDNLSVTWLTAAASTPRWASSFEVSRCNFHPNSDPKSKLDLNGRKSHFLGVSPKIVRPFTFAGVLDTTVIFRPMATSSWKPTTSPTMNLRSPTVADRRRSRVWCSGQNTCPLSRSCFLIVRQTLRRATRAKASVGCTAVLLGRRVFYVTTVPAWGGLRYRNVCVSRRRCRTSY